MDDRVAEAFTAVPREGFLRGTNVADARVDSPLPIGFGQTNSQPRTVAAMLRLLDVPADAHVLDVGAGSGWTTALLAWLVGPGGSVIGTELVPDLARWGAENLQRTGYDWARIEPACRSVLGAPHVAPFDRILVSAAAQELPAPLVDQLAPNSRMVVPVAGTMILVERTGADRRLRISEHGRYSFVPLIAQDPRTG